jgi:hypothetical protein
VISIDAAVSIVLTLVIAGVIFGLLFWLVGFCMSRFPTVAPFANVAYVILAILAVMVLIGILLSFSGHQVFRP